jgi:hypothetical protein
VTAPPPDARRPQAGSVSPAPAGDRPWFARTGLVFGALGLIVVGTVLVTPSQGEQGDRRLTTLSRTPYGARALADLVERSGWRVERDSSVPGRGPLPADRVYAVLAPPEPLTAREWSRVLDAVRRGAGLLVVHPGEGVFADSLGLERSEEGARMRVPAAAARDCPADEKRHAITFGGTGDVYSQWIVPKRPLSADTVHFLPVMRPLTTQERRDRGIAKGDVESATWSDPEWVEGRAPRFPTDEHRDFDDDEEGEDDDSTSTDSASTDAASADSVTTKIVPGTATAQRTDRAARRRARRDSLVVRQRVLAPAAIGIPMGRGRMVVVADGDWLRNDVLRVCRWHSAVVSVRMLEWVAPRGDGEPMRRVVFDEWHQGRGPHASAIGALGDFLVGDPRGRALTQALVAALVLLAALAVRPLVPVLRTRIERRSPFEHVGALARAYEEIGATRVVARRLVRGLRRRLGGIAAARDEEALLAILQARHPALAPEITLVREALETPRSPAALLEVGRAVATIERAVLRS